MNPLLPVSLLLLAATPLLVAPSTAPHAPAPEATLSDAATSASDDARPDVGVPTAYGVVGPGVTATFEVHVPERGHVEALVRYTAGGSVGTLHLDGLGECRGVSFTGVTLVAMGAGRWMSDCGVLEAGTYPVVVSTQEGAGAVRFDVEGAHVHVL